MNFEEKKLNSETVYKGKILTLNVDEVELPDKSRSFREYVRHSGGAAVLLVKDNSVLLVKQFRYAYGKELYEVPAGKLNYGENSETAAARELEEETGYRAKLVKMLDIYPSPGYTDEIIRIYFAESFDYTAQKLDEGEFLKCEFIALDKVLNMIETGEICDGKTVSAVYKYISSAYVKK